ncbi:MAG TPA: glycosyltransferase [Geminicoccaceae bacterium]|nr:glycosyltransferase [Geminicoccaceae bacterium]
MASLAYDVLLVSDLRLPGPTGRAVAEEIRAQAEAGYRTALLHVRSGLLRDPHPINPLIREAIAQGLADWLDPDAGCAARLAVAHHPGVFAHPPARVSRLVAERKVLAVNHPLLDAKGRPFFDLHANRLSLADLLGEPIELAPAGPQIRSQLKVAPGAPPLLEQDWPPVVEPGAFTVPTGRPWRSRVVVGRHGPIDLLAWPARSELVLGYPDDGDFTVRVLADRTQLQVLLGDLPASWTVIDPASTTARDFLATLDCYVHATADCVQPVRLEVVEALASGVPVVLPAPLRALFGEGAAYVEADGVQAAIRGLERPSVRAVLAERASELVAKRFSRSAHAERIRALIGPPAPTRSLALRRERQPRQRVLFLSSNGIGMGHLTRLLAVARRCERSIEPVFLAMSQAAKVVEDYGFLVEFTAHHLYLDLDVERWNQALRELLNEMVAFYDARALLFDGNVPYRGLIDARGDNPSVPFLWCRRGMWLPGAGRVALERARQFDAVVEPRDLAEDYDRGGTAYHAEGRRRVDPILLLDRHELLERAAARAELGMDLDRPAILIQLGSRNNYDYGELFDVAYAHLRQRYDVQIAVAEWLIAEAAPAFPAPVIRLQAYPLCRYFRAFDGAISAVGYNSYHELIYHGLPAIFVPNEHPSMDDQLMRALFAERRGLGFCVRTFEPYQLRRAIDRLMDPTERAAIARRCRALASANGADAVAGLLAEMTRSVAANAPPSWAGGLVRSRLRDR